MPLVNLICAHEDTIVLNTKSNQKHKKTAIIAYKTGFIRRIKTADLNIMNTAIVLCGMC